MFDFFNNYKFTLLPTNEELKEKKIRMLSILLIFMGLVCLYKNIAIYTTSKSIDKSFVLMEKIDKDATYDFLYFDKNLGVNVRESYKEMIDLQPEIANSLSKNKIKILISEDSIENSFLNVSSSKEIKVKDNTVGAFIKEYKLILLKYRNPKSMKVVKPLDIYNENKKERSNKNIEYTTLSDLYTDEQLSEFDTTLNKTVLYHEIGHYLDKFSKQQLSYNFKFYKAYLNEKNQLFASDDKYNISNLSEYIAQSVSYYLIYGSVEGKNNTLEPNTTETSKYISKLISEYKNTEGGEN